LNVGRWTFSSSPWTSELCPPSFPNSSLGTHFVLEAALPPLSVCHFYLRIPTFYLLRFS
jgi:hypothetical protein